ncbi:MAG: signal peptidase I [Clostridia bacterium]|nr:signal peptidase I [Clostridia bacterium]
MKEKEAVKKSIQREILEWIVCIVVAFVLAVIIKYFIFTPTLVKQTSMFPTIYDGDRVFVNRLVRTFHIPVERGDIVTIEKPNGSELTPEELESGEVRARYYDHTGWDWITYNMLEWGKTSYIKRIIGVSGDHILIENGKVYVNDEEIDESAYLIDGVDTNHYFGAGGISNDFIVPAGYVFAMGDNRGGSEDCRRFGCVPVEKVEGKVLFRLWPFDERFGEIKKSTLTYEESRKKLSEIYGTEL